MLAVHLADPEARRQRWEAQGQVVLALAGLQPDVGHEVMWVVRDVLSGEVLLAQSLLSGTEVDLTALLREVQTALPVPIRGVVSDGQLSIRKGVQNALPGVPHQLCQFHYLREAALPIYEADRHAKKALKKHVRGIRPRERRLETRLASAPHAAETSAPPRSSRTRTGSRPWRRRAVRGYCLAVRSALTDDGRPPLAASGLQLHARLTAIQASADRALAETAPLWPEIRTAFAWVHRAASLLKHGATLVAAFAVAKPKLHTVILGMVGALGQLAGAIGKMTKNESLAGLGLIGFIIRESYERGRGDGAAGVHDRDERLGGPDVGALEQHDGEELCGHGAAGEHRR